MNSKKSIDTYEGPQVEVLPLFTEKPLMQSVDPGTGEGNHGNTDLG